VALITPILTLRLPAVSVSAGQTSSLLNTSAVGRSAEIAAVAAPKLSNGR
jgi:hypothetical protein